MDLRDDAAKRKEAQRKLEEQEARTKSRGAISAEQNVQLERAQMREQQEILSKSEASAQRALEAPTRSRNLTHRQLVDNKEDADDAHRYEPQSSVATILWAP